MVQNGELSMVIGKVENKKIADIKIDGLNNESLDSSVRLAILTMVAGYLEKDRITVNGKMNISKDYLNKFLSYVLNDMRAAPRTYQLNIDFTGIESNTKTKSHNDYDLILSFSGGADSTAGLLLALDKQLKVKPVFICFGQKNERKELLCVKAILKKLEIAPLIINVDIDNYIDQDWKRWKMGIIPARNYLFAAIAGSVLSHSDRNKLQIWICAHREEIDNIHTDKSLRFFKSTTKILSNSYKKSMTVLTPFEVLSKPEIISYWHKHWEKKYDLYVENTVSCYFGNNCGMCKACINRAICFVCAGINLENFQVNPFLDQQKIIQESYIDKFDSLEEERRLDFVYSLYENKQILPFYLKCFVDINYQKYKKQINKRIQSIRNIDHI